MRKQTQTRQYGYVSPKCRTIRLDAGFCQVASPGDWSPGTPGNSGTIYEDEEL